MEAALNEEQRNRVLPIFAKDPRGMLGIGITEPDNASNYFIPHPTPFRTTAEKTSSTEELVDSEFMLAFLT